MAIKLIAASVAASRATRALPMFLAATVMAGCGGNNAPSAGPANPSSPMPTAVTASATPRESTTGSMPGPAQDLGAIVDSKTCGNFGWGNRGTARIAGVDYPESLPVACFNGGDVASADFLVPAGARLLTGAAGIDDHTTNTDAKASFSVLDAVTGTPLLASETHAYGQPATPLSASVAGVVRIRLQVRFDELKSGLITASWANMKFTA